MKPITVRRSVAGGAALALAAGAVAALASPAQAAATPSSLTLTPAVAGVRPSTAQTYSGVVSDAGGAPVAGTTLSIQAAQSVGFGTLTNPLTISGTGVSSETKSSNLLGGTATDKVTLATGTDGGYRFAVASKNSGTVTVTVTAGSATGTATLTVSAGGQGDPKVATVTVTPSASTQFAGASGPTYTVTAKDGTGAAVSGAEIDYSVTGPDASANGSHVIAGQTGSTGQLTATVPNAGAPGTDTITFYVDSGAVPSATAKATYAPVPVTTDITVSTPADDNATASHDQLPAGQAQTVPFTATLRNGTSAVADSLVVFTVSGAVSSTLTATTDATGAATVQVPVSAAAAANGATLNVAAAVGNPGQANYRASATKTLTFATPAPYLWFTPASSVQAAAGGTVKVTAHVTDQFGSPGRYAGDVLTYTISGRNTGDGTSTVGTAGTAQIAYADTGSSGTDTVTVTDTTTGAVNSNPNTTSKVTVTYLASVAPAAINVPAGAPSSATVSSTQTLPMTATVTNSTGDPLTYQPVTVTVSRGFVGASTVTAATGKATYSTTSDASGQISYYLGSTKAGVQTVTITAGKATTSPPAITYQPAAPYHVAISPASAGITSGHGRSFRATVTDEYGNAVVAGTALTVAGSGVGTVTSGSVPYVAVTGSAGTVPITVAVPATVSTGSGTVSATLTQTPAQAGDTSTAPVPAATAKYTVAPYTSRTGTAGSIIVTAGVGVAGHLHQVSALVLNTDGSRLVGRTVAFTVTGANPTARHLVTTNSSGVAVYRYATHRPGVDRVTAASTPVSTTRAVYVGQQPIVSASSPRRHTAVLTIRPVPHWRNVQVYAYRLGRGGVRIFAGVATTNSHGVAVVTVTGLKSGLTYRFTAWVNRQSVPELYARPVAVHVK